MGELLRKAVQPGDTGCVHVLGTWKVQLACLSYKYLARNIVTLPT